MEPVGMVMGFLVGVEDGLALARLEDSGGGAGEGSVSRVPNAVGRLDGEEALALEGQVEWIASGFHLTLSEIEAVSAEDAEAIYGLAYLRGGFGVLIDASSQDAAEVVALGAKAG